MQQEGISLDKYNFVDLINACVSLRSLEESKCVHAQIIENGYKFNMFVGVAWWTCV
jgi:hypothetical protein